MLKCPGIKCGRKLVNFEQCPNCQLKFHSNCLRNHRPSCSAKIAMFPNVSGAVPSAVASASVAQPIALPQNSPQVPNFNSFQPLAIQGFADPPGLPPNWRDLSADDKSEKIMSTLLEIRNQNCQLKTEIVAATSKINFHSEIIQSHDSEIHRISAEQADCRDALADRSSLSELIISGLPKNLNLDTSVICERIFAFLDLDRKFIEQYILDSRFVRHKKSQPVTNSLVIDMISDKVCEKVLSAAANKRKTLKLTVMNIFGINDESIIYINRMLSAYLQNVAFQARQAKKRLGWKSVSTFNGTVAIRLNDNSPPIIVSTLAQLENLSK